jgi:hypothetical protein
MAAIDFQQSDASTLERRSAKSRPSQKKAPTPESRERCLRANDQAQEVFSKSPLANEPDFHKVSEYRVCHQHGRDQGPVEQRKRFET